MHSRVARGHEEGVVLHRRRRSRRRRQFPHGPRHRSTERGRDGGGGGIQRSIGEARDRDGWNVHGRARRWHRQAQVHAPRARRRRRGDACDQARARPAEHHESRQDIARSMKEYRRRRPPASQSKSSTLSHHRTSPGLNTPTGGTRMARPISRRQVLTAAVATVAAGALGPFTKARAAAPIVLRVSSSAPPDKYGAHYLWFKPFEDNLKKLVGDQIKLEYFPNSQLGKEADVVQQVKAGSVDMMISGPSIWATVVPEIG